MAQVDGIGPADGPQKILGQSLRRMAQAGRPAGAPVDQVEFSAEARDMAALSRIEGIRHDVVARVRQEIASGAYETDEKWRIALGRLMDEIAREGRRP